MEKNSIDIVGENTEVTNGLTLRALIEQYQTDRVSGWRKLRWETRQNQKTILRRILEAYGDRTVASIRRRDVEEFYADWSGDGTKIAMGHSFVAQLRTVCNYGADMLENDDCEKICGILRRRKFPMAGVRKDFMKLEHAEAICDTAHSWGYHSIALAQALQFDIVLRQKDVLGSWVPVSEPGESDVVCRGMKWLRGLRWSEIDADLILTHVTSKKGKELVVDLKLAPLAHREILATPDWRKTRNGPVIVSEVNALPWDASEFRRKWRMIADYSGVPKTVWNMDSRSGGISEGTDAGMTLEQMRHAATHSNVATTAKYSRNTAGKVAESLKARAAHRETRKELAAKGVIL